MLGELIQQIIEKRGNVKGERWLRLACVISKFSVNAETQRTACFLIWDCILGIVEVKYVCELLGGLLVALEGLWRGEGIGVNIIATCSRKLIIIELCAN